jgi:predicted ATPase/class 3 adenylate cyclase
MPETLPTGTLTFVMTDVVGSTRLWDADDPGMRDAMRRHDEIIEASAMSHDGLPVRPRGEGDSRFLVFGDAANAVLAAVDMQRRLQAQEWPLPDDLRIRIGVHTGTAQLRDGDYYGSTVNRCARIRGIGHGGQILLSAATTALARDALPPGVSTLDLGEHLLRDLTRPERIHQVVADGLPTAFPPLASLSSIPNNLPAQVSEFVGRSRELREVCDLIGSHRLVTIVGPGGNGKTRLAVQAAAEVAHEYPDGVYLVNLSPVGDSTDVAQAIAETLGVLLAGDETVEDQLTSYLRGKHQLLVLDSFEHVRDAGPLVRRLLESAGDVTVLVTSRSQIGVTAEVVFSLGGLDVDWSPDADPESADGARLFIETAGRRDPTFTLRESDRPHLHEILHRTQGSPLAILLAATWVDILSVEEIARELRASLDILEAQMGDMPERHRSVRAVFDYSWRMLDSSEQALFARLSIFRGGFTREAAAAVAGASVRDLSRLVRQSLVVSDPEQGRFGVHELLREFGAEHLESSGDAEATTMAFLAHFGEVMDRVAADFTNGRQLQALAAVDADLDNLRAGWRLAIDRQAAVPFGYVVGLWLWYEVHGGFRPAVDAFTEAVDGFEPSRDPLLRRVGGLARASRGWFRGLLGDTDGGISDCDAATVVLDEVGNAVDIAFTCNCRNISLLYRGEVARLLSESDAASLAAAESGQVWWELMSDSWGCHAYTVLGELDRAADIATRVTRSYEALGELYTLIWVHEAQANIARARDNPAEARIHYERILEIAEAMGHGRSVHYTLNNLGRISDDLGDPEQAIRYYRRSLRLSHELGQIADVVGNLYDIARARVAAGQLTAAAEILSAIVSGGIDDLQRRFDATPLAELAAAVLADIDAAVPGLEAARRAGRERGIEGTVAALLTESD